MFKLTLKPRLFQNNLHCVQAVLFLVFVCWFLASCATTPIDDTPGRGVTEISDHSSPAGINYTLALMPDAQQASIHVIWPNDWAHNNNLAIASSLGTDLISSGGAGDRSAEQIKEDIIDIGSSASLVLSPDHVYATFTGTTKKLAKTLAIGSDVFSSPQLDAAQFNDLKDALQTRVQKRQLQPSAKLWSVARRVLLGNTSLTDYWNNFPLDTKVAPLTIESVIRWHEETFIKENVTVVVAGPLDTQLAGESVDQLLSNLPVGSANEKAKISPQPPAGYTVLLHDESISKTIISAIGRLPPSSEGNEISDILAVSILGKGKESRLVKAQKTNLPDAADINTSVANFSREARVFGISTETTNAEAAEVYKLIESTYQDFKTANLTDQEVLRASVTFANSLKENAQQVDLVAYGVGQLILDDLPKELVKTVMQDTMTLRSDEINQRITEKYPDWDAMIKVVMSSDAAIIAADCVVTRLEEVDECGY